MSLVKSLAIDGGEKSVKSFSPHFKWPLLDDKDYAAVKQIIDTGQISIYGLDGIVKEFEQAFSRYYDVPYAVSTNSGTAALYLAYLSLDIEPGTEVIVPTYTFPATITPLLHIPVNLVLCDADPVTGNISTDHLKRLVSPKTSAIAITHMWGLPCDMDEIMTICNKTGIKLIEDCSHAFGATHKGKLVGTFGDVSCFSLQANKLPCCGEGGMLITSNEKYYDLINLFMSFRKRPYDTVTDTFLRKFADTSLGFKFKIHPMAAALGFTQLSKAHKHIIGRHKRLNLLSSFLEKAKGIIPPHTNSDLYRGAWYGYKPLYDKEALPGCSLSKYINALQAEGVEVHKPGSKPIHMCNLVRKFEQLKHAYSFGHREKYIRAPSCRGAESYYNKALSLPTFTTEDYVLVEQYGEAFIKVGAAYAQL